MTYLTNMILLRNAEFAARVRWASYQWALTKLQGTPTPTEEIWAKTFIRDRDLADTETIRTLVRSVVLAPGYDPAVEAVDAAGDTALQARVDSVIPIAINKGGPGALEMQPDDLIVRLQQKAA